MKLIDVCEIIVDCPHSTVKDEGQGIPLVRTPNIGKGRLELSGVHRVSEAVYNQRIERAVPQAGDLILAREAPVGNVALIMTGQKVCLGQRVVLIRPDKEKADPAYLTYYLLSEEVQHRLKNNANGAVVAHLNMNEIRNLEIELPEISTQKRIASVLTSLDDNIALNNHINHNLEEQAQALYKSWFIDFEPFKDGKFVDSELGMIPEGWHVGHIIELISDTYNGDWGKEEEMGTFVKKVSCIRGADIPSIRVGNSGKMPVRFIQEKHFQSKFLMDDDIVVEISGGSPTQSTGRFCRITDELVKRYDNSLICTNFCKALRPKAGCSLYISYLWNDLYDRGIMFSYENGTTGIKNLDLAGLVSGESVIIPDQKSIQAFSNIVSSLNRQVLFNGHENEKLANQRDTILPKLMSGDVLSNSLTC